MRLDVVEHGHGRATKALFWLVRTVTRRPVPDAIKYVMYRTDFQGWPMRKLLHLSMHGPSDWSVAERELMAAYVSRANECDFCAGALPVGTLRGRVAIRARWPGIATAPALISWGDVHANAEPDSQRLRPTPT